MNSREPAPCVRTTVTEPGIAEIVMSNPPVNALPAAGWLEVAAQVTAAGQDPGVRAVVDRKSVV